MRIIRNEALIKRNGRIGRWASFVALAVLAAGMYISFKRPELFAYSIGALLLGFMLTQVGMYFSNRFGRSPRPDEILDAGLKGLPGDTALYHYATPVPHLLVGPMGIWVLLPYHQRGLLTFERQRWRLRGGGLMQAYMSVFGQEGLGRPDIEAEGQVQALMKHLQKRMEAARIPQVRAALVFTNDQAEIQGDGAPLPAVHVKKLKDFVRQKAREQPLATDVLRQVSEYFPTG